jgi:integrase
VRLVKEYVAKNGTKTWRVRYRLGASQHSETFRRKPDAETFAKLLDISSVDALRWLNDRTTAAPDAPTFGQWFDTYLAQLTGITPRTRDDYKAMHRRYLTDLDPLPLPLLTRAHVAATVNRLEAEGKSPKTIKNVIHMLSSVLGLAVDEGHLTRNPTKRVRLPKAQLVEHEERFLSYEEAAALLDATDAHYQPLVAFLLSTGLRWSEATAVQTRHVNLEAGTVRVERAWKRIPGGWEIGPPKSPKARRTVNAGVLALVAVAPLLGKPSDLVFTTTTGKPVRHSNFYNRIWRPACIAAGLATEGSKPWDGPGPHNLRHTHASWLLSDIGSIEAVQDQLGHESAETTRKVYAHLLPAVGVAVGKSASAAMERVLAHRVDLRGGRLLQPAGDSYQSENPAAVGAHL